MRKCISRAARFLYRLRFADDGDVRICLSEFSFGQVASVGWSPAERASAWRSSKQLRPVSMRARGSQVRRIAKNSRDRWATADPAAAFAWAANRGL